MLVVVLGAGASFDSNPSIPVSTWCESRPPLANNLFDMDRAATREAAAALPRAAPALMAARADVKNSQTVEATLTRLQVESSVDPLARSQLMALRFYLQQVLLDVQREWEALAVRQTSYVSMLDQLARWSRVTGEGLCLVTFNYDLLLESACGSVFGTAYTTLQDYQAPKSLHLYKPHGSVNWAQPAAWSGGGFSDQDAARRAVCDAPDLALREEYHVRAGRGHAVQMARGGEVIAWVPALAIPVELKPDLVMPSGHRQALAEDLGQATGVLCIGWRARERHFLQFLEDSLPNARIPLVAVSDTTDSALETVNNLWETGRFNEYQTLEGGFSRFADPEPPPKLARTRRLPLLMDVLRGRADLVSRAPGNGLAATTPSAPVVTYKYPDYGSLGKQR